MPELNTPLLDEAIHQLGTPMVPQEDGMLVEEGGEVTPMTEKKLTRKRKREPTKWNSCLQNKPTVRQTIHNY